MNRRYGTSNDHLFRRSPDQPSKKEAIAAAAARAALFASGHVDEDGCDCNACRAGAHHTCVLVGVDDHDECEICGTPRRST
jgi:hypothetical protein